MFMIKFLENLFNSSLKDKPGQSVLPAYLLAWLVINVEFCTTFLTISGEFSDKFAAALEQDVSMYWPLLVAIGILIITPWFKNLSLAAREYSDYKTQSILQALKIKSYKTIKEFDELHRLYNKEIALRHNAVTDVTTLQAQIAEQAKELESLGDKLEDKETLITRSNNSNQALNAHIKLIDERITQWANKSGTIDITELTKLDADEIVIAQINKAQIIPSTPDLDEATDLTQKIRGILTLDGTHQFKDLLYTRFPTLDPTKLKKGNVINVLSLLGEDEPDLTNIQYHNLKILVDRYNRPLESRDVPHYETEH